MKRFLCAAVLLALVCASSALQAQTSPRTRRQIVPVLSGRGTNPVPFRRDAGAAPATATSTAPAPAAVLPPVNDLDGVPKAGTSHTFATFNTGVITGGGASFTRALDVSGLAADEYLFVMVTADFVPGTVPNDGWSSTMFMELSNGSGAIHRDSATATYGVLPGTGSTTLKWSGILRASYTGGNPLTIRFRDGYTDGSGPYTSQLNNVVVSIYPATVPKKTFAAFNTGVITGGGSAFTRALDVSGMPGSQYLFVIVTGDFVPGTVPNDGWSSTMYMELNNGSGTVYRDSATATYGVLPGTGSTSLKWVGQLSLGYTGGGPLTVKFRDGYTDGSGPYTSQLNNVVVTIYPSPVPIKTFAAFNTGTLTGGGSSYSKSLDVSGMPAAEHLFFNIKGDFVSNAPPNHVYSSSIYLELNNGGATIYKDSSAANFGARGDSASTTLKWLGMLKNVYPGATTLNVRIRDIYTDASGPYYSNLNNVTVTLYPAADVTCSISGNAGVAGATLSYTDGTPQTATADGSGNYSFAVSSNWTGTVTPSMTGYTFSPASRTYTNITADQTGQDYTASPVTYAISGSAGADSVILSYDDGGARSDTADASGNYSFAVSYNWSGTVTPSKAGYAFDPSHRDYSGVLAGQAAQDYVATPPPVATAATGIAGQAFTANWDAAAGATKYYLDVAADSGFVAFVSGYQDLDVGLVTTCDVSGLGYATPYYYRVRAANGGGTSGNSNTISLATLANQGPAITMTLQPGDTYDGSGPFMVRAVITDPAKVGIASADIYYSLNGSAWNSGAGVPMAADTFNFGITGGLSNGTLVSYYIRAEDDAVASSYSPANAPVGLYSFRILDPLPPTALNATGLDMAVDLSWAPPAQILEYNTGAYYGYSAPSGFIQSTRFTPMHYPCRLEQATSLWFNGAGMDSVIVHVYADDGTGMPDEATELMTPFRVMPQEYPAVTVVDLSGRNIVLASGEFHVGYEIVTAGQPAPMRDGSTPNVIRSLYKWTNGYWYGDMGDSWIDQAVVSYSSYTKGLALKSSHLRKGQKPNYLTTSNNDLKPAAIANRQAVVYPKLTGALAMAKYCNGYTILRGDASGGPYTVIGMSGNPPTHLDNTASNGTPYYYVVRAEYSTPDTFSAYSNEATATPAVLPILLVDDDGSDVDGNPDVRSYYTAALDAAGQAGNYAVFNSTNSGAGPDTVWLRNRTHVIWFTGLSGDGSDSTLTPANEDNLKWCLDNGGKLFLSGDDYLYQMYNSAGYLTAGQFPFDYLGVDSTHQDTIYNTAFGISGAPLSLAEGQAFTVGTAPVTLYVDELIKRAAAMDVFDLATKMGEKLAVQYSNGTFRTVFFAFPFENITDGASPNTKGELMARILSWMATGVEGNPAADLSKPAVYCLNNCYPNPVRNNATVKYALPKAGRVNIAVYNVAGQKVRTLVDGTMNAGFHTVNWNGKNEGGQAVAGGVYLYQMQAGGFNSTRKIVVIR